VSEIDSAFAEVRKQRIEAVIVTAGGVNWANRKRVFELAALGRIPAVYATTEFTKEGSLMSYGVDFLELTRAADYVDKILRGKAPSDLPVEQPTKFDLVINLKTARTLGLTIPPSLLLRADQVIE
jgi:putative ABC transport system substrate-binding protein